MFYLSRRVPSVTLCASLAWPAISHSALAFSTTSTPEPGTPPSAGAELPAVDASVSEPKPAEPAEVKPAKPPANKPKGATAGASVSGSPPTSAMDGAPLETDAAASTDTAPEATATTSVAEGQTAEGPSAEPVAAAESRRSPSERYSPRDPNERSTRWIHRYPTQAMTGEVGLFAGVWFPSRRHEFYEPVRLLPDSGYQRLAVAAADLGVRGGFYPFRFFGVELEAAVMPTRTRDTEERATAWALRGHVVAQLGLWSITPFLLAGAGMVGISGDPPPASLGKDQDVAIHFGGGAKVQINDWVQARLDIRNVVANRRGVGEGLASSPEILLGVSVTLGRRRDKGKTADVKPDDRDGDGVLDADDYCVDVYGEPPRGCPQVCVDDSDGDGLTDPVDQCPTEPETRNGFEDLDGCPDEVPPELVDLSGVMEGIQFDTDKDTIKDASQPMLDHAIEVMQKYPDLRVEIGGHTDARGAYRHNMDLSQRRSEAVKAYLVGGGVAAERVETRGYGPDQPIETNETAEGRAANRRIEFKILNEDAAVETK